MAIGENELLEYACGRFEAGLYDEALEAFVLAYARGYEREWILDNIYSCYMAGNEEEFAGAYAAHRERVGTPYEDCPLDFVPYQEGSYYIFDKQTREFAGIFSVEDLRSASRPDAFQTAEFSAILLDMGWDWRGELPILAEAKNRDTYVVSHDAARFASFAKIPELSEYFSHIRVFADPGQMREYFHQHTAVYLPKIICAEPDAKPELDQILAEEHSYRLTPEGRDTGNVLLTIGIPTHARGNQLLERLDNLLNMTYDAEIEIAVSKNGNQAFEEEYARAGGIKDARLIYYDHGGELLHIKNWRHVVDMAHGRYVVFVSDEDDVDLLALEHYLRLLSDNPQLSVIRAKTEKQYRIISERSYGKKGLEAFFNLFLRQNYLSGLIVRRKDFIDADLPALDEFMKNPFYVSYPHEWWCATLSRNGDSLIDPEILIRENDPAGYDGTVKVNNYATYQSRIRQFTGMVEFLHWYMDDEPDGLVEGLKKAISKTAYLMVLARSLKYEKEQFDDSVMQFCETAIEAIDGFQLDADEKVELLRYLEGECVNNFQIAANFEREEEGRA